LRIVRRVALYGTIHLFAACRGDTMSGVTASARTRPVPPDIEIAEAAEPIPVVDLARDRLGIDPEHLVPYGHTKAKISLGYLRSLADRPDGRLVLVTAISPTPAGEGKTTTSVGLADALSAMGERAIVALREPSMGPVFGIKGGAAGGGYAQVVPMTDINLNFTGDFAAIAAANNLLAAVLDNHLHQGNALDIDPRTITWKRVVDLNDRALRDIVVGLGGVTNGVPREDGFDIVVASEVMAILCLATSIADLRERLGAIVVGYTRAKQPVRARDLKVHGAMTVILREALAPNLVQTLEHTPAMIHGGPFANIAHGCNSVMATSAALKLADYVITEAGFGADLGAEKFIDIKCRLSGIRPSAVVVVATVRALKYHGGVAVSDLAAEDVAAVGRGMANLRRHLRNVRDVYGLPPVVALNRFPSDTDAEVAEVVRLVADEGFEAYEATHYADGGVGATDLARGVLEAIESETGAMQFVYPDDLSIAEKAEAVATRVYGASGVVFERKAARRLAAIEAEGYGHLPICMAKTQSSFSTDATVRGAPAGHTVSVREVRLAAGAGFVVLVTGDIMTMPGLPRVPASEHIDVDDDGRIVGLS
jgi:formate--tetrahydrofolate ligase